MKPLRSLLGWLALPVLALVAVAAAEPAPRSALAWDAMEKTISTQPGDAAADFSFTATNKSDHSITITGVRPSCGCTTVDLPPAPWTLAPGASGTLRATIVFEGKEGELSKSIAVESSAGVQTLFIHVDIAPADPAERLRNRKLATDNRQAVFRGECASCHVMPALGKSGEALFKGACAVCHASARRASMVPDLFTARTHRDAAWWRAWITAGKEGTLMPAFAEANGGPLSAEQIESLIVFALEKLPTEPRAN